MEGVLEPLTRAYGSALRAVYILSGMTERIFAADVLAGRGERTLRRWLNEPARTPPAVERWAARVAHLEVGDDGCMRLCLSAREEPPRRRGRPRAR